MNKKIAYFSAEIGIDSKIKTYSGGLGILAGDTIKAMADLDAPFCAITLLYKKGFLKQKIIDNVQVEEEDDWNFLDILKYTNQEVIVNIANQDIYVKIWKYEYTGINNSKVPIYFLDTDIDKNPKWAQCITNKLYQGNRLYQEMILGIGGVRALEKLGHTNIEKYHMNEGHSCFLTLELYKKFNYNEKEVRKKCVFTTHTPIPAGHDKFEYKDIYEAFDDSTGLIPWHIEKLAGYDKLNTTLLAMNFSNYTNGVSKKHGEVSSNMFPDHKINYITNGIHVATWISPHMEKVFDKYIDNWRKDNSNLSKIFEVDNSIILDAHLKSKTELIDFVNSNNITNASLNKDKLTIGFARRFIEYKDADLIFKNLDNLKELGSKVQFIFAGKSHSKDGLGKSIMKKVIEYAKELHGTVEIAFIENYNIEIAKKLVQGCDLWLNTPIPPNEASGTSGMKAAVNGCLHFSTLDGWALESFEKNGGGFPIYKYEDFFINLKYKIIPRYYCQLSTAWVNDMKLSIGNSGSYFNTHRMAKEYLEKAYKINLD